MASQESILIGALIKKLRDTRAPEISEDRYFELFLSEQILKEHDLSYDELSTGNLGNGGDGGIDSFYIFVNNVLLQTDTVLSDFRKNLTIELHIIQAKNTNKFEESVFQKFNDSAEDIFDLNKSIHDLKPVYNEALLNHIKLFRDTYLELIAKQPQLIVNYYYGSKGDDIHPNVSRKITNLESTIKKYFPKAEFDFQFLTAADLLEKSRIEKKENFKLQLSESPITTSDGGYICICGLKSYYEFITDESDDIVIHIFDANVRDHQKSTTVNREIGQALQSNNPEDFWWLNNGITILSDKVNLSGKILTIQDPQVVNGCQTSFEIFNFFNINKRFLKDEKRNIMVRVIETSFDDIKSRIIKSTNSQTAIPAASLRSTDTIHRNIEQYFENNGLFYDRRKNFWKNQGKPISSIITIPYLSQTLMAMILKQPDNARSKPSTLIKDDSEYQRIFNTDYHLDTYLSASSLQKRIEKGLVSASFLERGEALNIRWFVSMAIVLKQYTPPIRHTSNILSETVKFNSIDFSRITDEDILETIGMVSRIYRELGKSDAVAKSRAFTEKIIAYINDPSIMVEEK